MQNLKDCLYSLSFYVFKTQTLINKHYYTEHMKENARHTKYTNLRVSEYLGNLGVLLMQAISNTHNCHCAM